MVCVWDRGMEVRGKGLWRGKLTGLQKCRIKEDRLGERGNAVMGP